MMPRLPHSSFGSARRWRLGALMAMLAVGCRSASPGSGRAGGVSSTRAAASAREVPRQPVSSAAPASASASLGRTAPSSPPESRALPDELAGGLTVARAESIGPAGAARATPAGVVFVTNGDELRVLELALPSSARSTFKNSFIEPPAVAALNRRPIVLARTAYWISGARLLRAPLAGGHAEEIASDAEQGTRPSGLHAGNVDAVAYVGRGRSAAPKARLWTSLGKTFDLSPEGASATSVALFGDERDLTALSLEGRSGMSPLHARRVRLTKAGPTLDEDRVIWVGGAAQPWTEVTPLTVGPDTFALLPIERSATQFGLALVRVPPPGDPPSSDTAWIDYPNGLDPAPVAAGTLCGESCAVFARPADVTPAAGQELRLTCGAEPERRPGRVIAHAQSFRDVSLATTSSGGLIVYVGDNRTSALSVRCPRPAGRAR